MKLENQHTSAVIEAIADEALHEPGYRFGPSDLQAKLDNLDAGEESSFIESREDFVDLLHAELIEASHYDELPAVIRPLMARNAFDLGEVRANLLFQAALGAVKKGIQVNGVLTVEQIELANTHADILVDALKLRRQAFDARVEKLHERS